SKTHDEVTSPSDYNLILVGGPCANPLVETVFGLTCDGWTHSAGEAVVKLAANGDKVALLVAGTDALDTRRAGKAVAAYTDYTFEGTEVLVKGATLTDITVEKSA
ncbi:MAG: S-layer protein, partial [archaeon]